jgi:parallel beta-helix repeat protein
MLILFLVGSLSLAFDIHTVKADPGTIYIRADGSIDPPTAPILTVDNVTYILTGNILSNFDGIVVERDGIVVDGSGFTIEGTRADWSSGIYLDERNNVTIQNTLITNFYFGIWLNSSSDFNNIDKNTITNNSMVGIGLTFSSSHNNISGNGITNNVYAGIGLDHSSNNCISRNTIANDGYIDTYGISLWSSSYNSISGNNITNNNVGIYLLESMSDSIIGNNITASVSVGIDVGSSTNDTISGNTVTYDNYGISFGSSSNNSINGNNITNNENDGIGLGSSFNNSISGNNITNNQYGIDLWNSSDNEFYHNNLINNYAQVYTVEIPKRNVWDDGYPSGGNYWSGYSGVDVYSGPSQNQLGSDGIGDSSYVIGANDVDNYPLMKPYVPFVGQPIYVRADGSIDPTGAPILRDGDFYKLTDNIDSAGLGIVIERNNMTLDGAGYTLSVAFNPLGVVISNGISLSRISNVTIKNIEINGFWLGVSLESSTKCSISGNNITNNWFGGVELSSSSNNFVSGNKISGTPMQFPFFTKGYGVLLSGSSDNSVLGNLLVGDGLFVSDSYGNTVLGNLMNVKPLVYLENVSDSAVVDAGQVILVNCNRIRVENLSLSRTSLGIELWQTNNTQIVNNNIAANIHEGVYLHNSSGNSVSGNNITNNWGNGVELVSSSNNMIYENNITANMKCGILLSGSSNNRFFHNDFIGNAWTIWNAFGQVHSDSSTNVWDDGYPSGGNYWSDYVGIDSAPTDGIGDTPYIIDVNNTDHYPLMAPTITFNAGIWNGEACCVHMVSNSTISNFSFNPTAKTLSFNVTGTSGTKGFCRVTIPKALMSCANLDDWTVTVNRRQLLERSITTDANCTYIYFTYSHSTKLVQIQSTDAVPEFKPFMLLPLFMITTLLLGFIFKRKSKREKR